MENIASNPVQQQPSPTVQPLLSQDIVSEIADKVSECIREILLEDRSAEPDPGEYLNKQQAADFLGLKTCTLSKWIVDSKGPKYCKMGSRVYYKRTWLNEYRDRNTIDPQP